VVGFSVLVVFVVEVVTVDVFGVVVIGFRVVDVTVDVFGVVVVVGFGVLVVGF